MGKHDVYRRLLILVRGSGHESKIGLCLLPEWTNSFHQRQMSEGHPDSADQSVSNTLTHDLPPPSVSQDGPPDIGFLIAMMFVNLASLILTFIAMFVGKKVLSQFDPTVPRSLTFASGKAPDTAGGAMEGWDCQVNFNVSANPCL
jgi:hypothetical protein